MNLQGVPNTTAKLTVLVLLVLGLGSILMLGSESKDIVLTIASGLIGFLAKDLIKSDPTT